MAESTEGPNGAREGECAVIVLAGGTGTRLRAGDNKAYVDVGRRPLLAWSLATFAACDAVDRLVVVARAGETGRAREVAAQAAGGTPVVVVEGGTTRYASERSGLAAVAGAVERGEIDVVCIHDSARPFASEALVRRVITTARAHGGAVPCLPLPGDTLLRADPDGQATEAVPTADLRRAQTPQGFAAQALLDAYEASAAAGFDGVDTASCVERFGTVAVKAVDGEPGNIKVTYAADLDTAHRLAAEQMAPRA